MSTPIPVSLEFIAGLMMRLASLCYTGLPALTINIMYLSRHSKKKKTLSNSYIVMDDLRRVVREIESDPILHIGTIPKANLGTHLSDGFRTQQ